MLLDFTVGNFGPFKNDTTLSMNATKITEHRNNLLSQDLSDKDVLSSAIIFGPNAAGKSFIIDALYILTRIVQTVDDNIPSVLYVPYRLTKECRESPVRIRIRLIIEGILYDYRVEYTAGTITSESLYHYPKGRSAKVFIRTGPDEFKESKKRIASMTTSGKTYLAMAAVAADPVCTKVRNAIINGIVLMPNDPSKSDQESCTFSEGNPGRKAMMVKALGTADLGISDFTYNERRISLADLKKKLPPELYEIAQGEMDFIPLRDIFMRHDFTSPDVDEEGRVFPMELESAGTSCMFGLLSYLIDALENGKILVIDELGSHLHPMLTRWIVKQFSMFLIMDLLHFSEISFN